VQEYGEQVGQPLDGKTFVPILRKWLEELATTTDASFPANTSACLEDGKILLRKLERRALPEGFPQLQALIRERMLEDNIVDILTDIDHWLHWTRYFGPFSGFEPKLRQSRERDLTTAFCYGGNLGHCCKGREGAQLGGLTRENGAASAIACGGR
jgi:hypothetical protein